MDGSRMEMLILIVSYNGGETAGNTVRHCLANTRNIPVLVVDNASTDNTVSILHRIEDSRLQVFPLSMNAGLGAAFNAGIKKAVSLAAKWLFVLDQDSLVAPECLERLAQTAREMVRNAEPLAAVAPTIRSKFFPEVIHYPLKWNGRQLIPLCSGILGDGYEPLRVDSPISSGTLYRVEALITIQGFRESYFIDFIDHECHLRLRDAGYSLWWEPRAVMYHQMGSIQRMTASGFWIEHPAYRYYYMARNMSEGYYRLGGLCALVCFWKEAVRHMMRLYVNGRYPYKSICYILRGCCDAVIGKSGPLASNR
jgi:rhamnosyltransferase